MGFVEVEKKNTVTINGMSTDDQVQHLGTLGDDNLGSLNLEPTSYEYNPSPIRDAGMSYGHVKKEVGIVKICFTTLFILVMVIGITALAGYLAIKFSKVDINLFPKLESYNLEQYNSSVKRCFLILSGMLFGTCILVLFVFNIIVKSRFINNYLSKIGTYIYSVFALVVNAGLFLGVIYVYFLIVNRITSTIKGYVSKGIITETVNVKTIELFKYAIIVFCVIFLVVNSFNIVGNIKEKNRFVFEEEV
ncbi:MAG: hypothetical protein II625_07390 [Bacilli bacterium]|nr:hypothetical protein [Bacilli bacterium]